MSEDVRAPAEWEAELDVRVLDADGWNSRRTLRGGGFLDRQDWSVPVTRDEFELRLSFSTAQRRARFRPVDGGDGGGDGDRSGTQPLVE